MGSDFTKINNKLAALERYLTEGVKTTIGVEAVNHFKESFQNQGFTDQTLEKWDEVERRKKSSEWYGFQYGSTAARPGQKRRFSGSQTNYSNAATKRPVLTGETLELMNSISYRGTIRGVRITASAPYAKLINEGGSMKVFGRSGSRMPRRQFMGPSAALNDKIAAKIKMNVAKILR